MKNVFSILLFLSAFIAVSFAQLTPQDAITQMVRGINIGNTMEYPLNEPIQEYYFDDYKEAGFQCIRIPVKWGNQTTATIPYSINTSWINTVEKVVDWGLERDLFIIINGHHEDWLKQDYSETNKTRYDSIWSQIATRFKDKSEKLLFEIINEPFGMTKAQVDDLNSRIISIVRKTNPTRIMIYSGRDYSGLQYLWEASIPVDDFLMGYFHSYDPWDFAGEGIGTWGRDDINETKARFAQAAQWSNNNNIPVMISEFGARQKCDYNSRMLYYATNVEEAIRNNVAYQVWDDQGWFGIYERAARSWPEEVKDILTKAHPDGPTSLTTFKLSDTSVFVKWINRTNTNQKVVIERKVNDGKFEFLSELPIDDNDFIDNNVSPGNSYYYRIISSFDLSNDFYSYPIKIDITGTTIVEDEKVIPLNFSLTQNYPNPFNPKTTIDYVIAANDHVTLTIYDIAGKEKIKLVDEFQSADFYRIKFDATNYSSGIYFAKLQTSDDAKVIKMTLIK